MSILRGSSQTDLLDKINNLEEKLSYMQTFVEKSLHLTSNIYDLYGQRSSRSYYFMGRNWGLTRLTTGEPFYVNTEDQHVSPWVIMGGNWETNVDRVLVGYAQPGDTVIDIGSHIGYYTVKLSAKVGAAGRVHAFDPNPEVAEFCLANIRINGFIGITSFHEMALSDRSGTAQLSRATHAMASANIVGDLGHANSIDVPMARLDDISSIDRPIDLIKLDAEGSEVAILKGAEALLQRSPRAAIMIELGLDRWGRSATVEDVVPLCGGGGREMFAVHDDGTIEAMSPDAIKEFVGRGMFREEYVLVALPDEVKRRIPELLRQ